MLLIEIQKWILPTLVLMPRVVSVFELDEIGTIIEVFDLRHPTIVKYHNKTFLKALFYMDQYITVVPSIHDISMKNDSTPLNIVSFEFSMPKESRIRNQANNVLIVSGSQTPLDEFESEINQRMFIFNTSTKAIYESYHINNHHIKQKLGTTFENYFAWENGVNPQFLPRRANFQRKTLNTVTQSFGEYIILNPLHSTIAPYFPENETYLVNGFISGLCMDLLQDLQNQLNFTTNIFKPKQYSWGYGKQLANGTTRVTGLLGKVYDQSVDFILGPMHLNHERSFYADILQPIVCRSVGLFIANVDAKLEYDYLLLVSPFGYDLWIMVLVTTLVISVSRIVIMKKYSSFELINCMDTFGSSFGAFFGGSPNELPALGKSFSHKMIISLFLLCGMISWAAYQSFLTAELSVHIKKFPFTDLESFSKTNWRYFLNGITIHHRVLLNIKVEITFTES